MTKKMNRTGTFLRLGVAFILTAALFLSTVQSAFAMSILSLPSVGPVIAENVVRVHLTSYGDRTSYSMDAIGIYTIEDNNTALSGSFTVSTTGSGIRITSSSGTMDLDGDVYIKAANLTANNLIKINGAYQYAGDMRILNKGGVIKLINHVDIETYVCGVVPFEVNDSWPIESLKAQAVAARTYAYYTMNSRIRSSVEQDMVNSVSNQVYYGYNSIYSNSIRAVNETKNMILKTTTGDNVYACFSASNGGATESGPASGAAAREYDYLPIKDDPYDLRYALSTTSYSGKLTIPKTISLSNLQTSSSQPYKMIREKLTATGVNVNAIAGDITIKDITLTDPKSTSPERRFTGARFTIGIPNASDVTIKFDPYRPSGSSSNWPFLNEIMGYGTKFSILYLRNDDSSWLLASVRYGHGAGMSQVGAYQMAAEGKNYREILTFYFNLGTAVDLLVMPWTDGSGGNGTGYIVTEISKTGVVNVGGSTLNVRSGPATGYSVVDSLNNGAKVVITGQAADWWRLDLGDGKVGFVSSAFITLDSPPSTEDPTTPPEEKPDPPKPVSKVGTVNTPDSYLNIRSGPGTTYPIVGNLKHGSAFAITGESGDWYTLLYNAKTAYVHKSFVTVGTTTTPPTTPPGETTPPTTPTTKTGTVNTPGTYLNIRSGAGTNHSILGNLKHGATFTITGESGDWYTLAFNGTTGYVNKNFVTVGTSTTPPTETTPPTTPTTKTGIVNTPGSYLNVRSGAGNSYSVIGSIGHGVSFTITGESGNWYSLSYNGKTGYVSKDFVKTDGSTTTSPTTGKVINAPQGLNVRSGPGTNYRIVGYLSNGTTVTITGTSGTWYKITFEGKDAYISQSYISK